MGEQRAERGQWDQGEWDRQRQGDLRPAGGRSLRPRKGPPRRLATVALAVLVCGRGGLLAPAPLPAQLPEDPPRIITADESLSEEQKEHVEAVTLFAHGRVLLQRGLQQDEDQQQQQFASALRQFQRAWRLQPDLVSILEDIVPIAFQLDRKLEATRYLIIAAQQQELPVELLEQVAAQLANMDEFDLEQAQQALALYQKLKQLRGDATDLVTQFEIGRLSLTTGRFEQAAEAFQAVQQALEDPQNPSATKEVRDQLLRNPEITYALLGECYLRAQRLDAAEAAFHAADKAKPNTATLGLRLALVESKRGNRDAALQQLDQYFAAKSTAAGLAPYVLLRELIDGTQSDEGPQPSALSEESTGPPRDEAPASGPVPSSTLIERLKELAQADPNNPLLGYFLADALRRSERWDEAASLYKKLLEQKPTLEGYRGLVDIYLSQKQLEPLLLQLGEVAWKFGSLDPLASSVNAIVADPGALDGLTQLARELGAQADPPHGILTAVALLQGQAAHADLAREFMHEGLQQPGPAAGQCAISLAFQMLQADQPRHAAELFQRVLDEKLLPEKLAEVNYYLAGAWTLAKDTDKALEAARRAGQLEPASPRMLAREAWVLYQAKRLDEAKLRYLEILDRFDSDHASPENREVMRDIRMILSALDVELGDLGGAEAWLQQVLDEFPEDIGAFNDLGYLWCDQGKHLERSLRMVQRAVKAEPDNIAYRDSLGWALFRLGRFQEAVGELEKAAQGDKVDGVILDHLGDAYLQTDQQAQALEAWRKAAQAFQQQGDHERYQALEAKIKNNSAR